jgi:DNA-directed RNA polymerase subunit RPC12/RpoP
MPKFDYKCPKCDERHVQDIPLNKFEETYHVPCPFCGFVSRRMPTFPDRGQVHEGSSRD